VALLGLSAVLLPALGLLQLPQAVVLAELIVVLGGVRLGLPLKLLVCAVCWLLIPQLWSLG
jgi:hypothetical protein